MKKKKDLLKEHERLYLHIPKKVIKLLIMIPTALLGFSFYFSFLIILLDYATLVEPLSFGTIIIMLINIIFSILGLIVIFALLSITLDNYL